MAVLLTNGIFYVKYNEKGRINKTLNIEEAYDFCSIDIAIQQKEKEFRRCASYYCIDTESEEYKEAQKQSKKYVITNGTDYICLNEERHYRKTKDKSCALQYKTIEAALKYMQKAPGKTYGFSIIDENDNIVLDWNNMEHKEPKKKRKQYSKNARRMIYDKSDGRCTLCGRRILFEDMTLDHIVPLSMNGEDEIENLQAAHSYCNHFKGNILPDEFADRITEIFLYQIGKKYGNELKWEIIQTLIDKEIKNAK